MESQDVNQEVSAPAETSLGLEAWMASFPVIWSGEGPVKRLLAGRLDVEGGQEVRKAWQAISDDKRAFQDVASAFSGEADEALWFFRSESFSDLHFPPTVLDEAFAKVGEVPQSDVLAPESAAWMAEVVKVLLPRTVRNAFAWKLLQRLPATFEGSRKRDCWMIMIQARELEGSPQGVPIVLKAMLQESMMVWAEKFDLRLYSALRMAGVDFGQAPRYGSQGFQEWVDAFVVSPEGEDKILSFLADRLGTSEAAIEEVHRLAREAIQILDDPLFEKHLMPPKEMKGLAKMLKKRRFDMMKGKSPQSVLQEIFCKKPEDHLAPKRKKKIMASVEEYAVALGPERTWQKLRTQIALCLLQREVSEKDPFLIEYVTRPAFRFYQDHYAEG